MLILHPFGLMAQSQVAKLFPSDPSQGAAFANLVALDGTLALFSAQADADSGSNAGAAYIFSNSGGTWTQEAKLFPKRLTTGDRFSSHISLSGNRALIGAVGDDEKGTSAGAAYIFEDSSGFWVQKAKLSASDAEASDQFGKYVALDGNRAIIHSQDDENGLGSGSVYVFELSGGNWAESAKLTASDGATLDDFGFSLALDGDRAIIGAIGDSNNTGAVYIFDYDGAQWNETVKLTANDAAEEDFFGNAVALEGDRALIGAWREEENGTDAGAVYVFELSGGNWTQTAKLIASDGAANDAFGVSVALDGDRALIGAYLDDVLGSGLNAGSVYIFDYTGSVWSETDNITANDGVGNDDFGRSISFQDSIALIGAVGVNNLAGAAYVFNLNAGCTPPTAAFTFTFDTLNQIVNFTNQSGGTSPSYQWLFGPFGSGGTSTLENPTYNYAGQDSQLIFLIATNSCGVDSSIEIIVFPQSTSIETLPSHLISIHPNPFQNLLEIDWRNFPYPIEEIRLTSIAGKILRREALTSPASDRYLLSTPELPPGIYLLEARSSQGRVIKRVAKH